MTMNTETKETIKTIVVFVCFIACLYIGAIIG